MSIDMDEALVEKAREAVARHLRPEAPQPTDDALARAVLAAVLPDLRHAARSEAVE